MAPIGGLDLDEAVGVAFDDLGHAAEIPAAIDGCARRLMLARLVQRFGDLEGRPMGAAEAVRLAGQLARTLDQLVAEGVPASRLPEAVPDKVAAHLQQTMKILRIVHEQWPEVLHGLGPPDAGGRLNPIYDG